MSLDSTAHRLLFALDCNSRQSYASLARNLRIPEETVRYRYRRLTQDNIIGGCYPVIDVGQLGVSVHKVMLRLTNIDEQGIRSVADYIAVLPEANWVCTFDGSYQLGFTLFVERLRSVFDCISDLRKRFPGQISELAYAVNIQAEFFPRSYLNPKRKERKAASYQLYPPGKAMASLDAQDWSILRGLSSDARIPVSRIAEELHYTPEAVARRIKKLEQSGVITGYRLNLSNESLGNLNYYILLYLRSTTPDEVEKLCDYLRQNKLVVYLIRMLGGWDLDVCIDVTDANAYRSFVLDLTRHFGGIIERYETLLTWHVHKFSIVPPVR